MRKNDLKVGETYAVFLSPTRARRSYSYDKPLKAKLVAVQGEITETLNVVGFNSYGKLKPYEDGPKEVTVRETGIVVDLVDDTVRRGEISPSGRYVQGGSYYGKNRGTRASYDAAEEYENGTTDDLEKNMVARIALENGGCFISTWAEYEESVIAEQLRKARHDQERRDALTEAQAAEPAAYEQLERVLSVFRTAGFDVREGERNAYISDAEYLPEAWYARKDGRDVTIVLNYHGNNWRVERKQAHLYPLAGCKIKDMTGSLLLALTATPLDEEA